MPNMEATIDELEVEIEYRWMGRYYPETREQPAEYPEPEITDVRVVGNGQHISILAALDTRTVDILTERVSEERSFKEDQLADWEDRE